MLAMNIHHAPTAKQCFVCRLILQLWNLPWWHCSAGSCVDPNINEIDYMETVIKTVLAKFSVDKSKVHGASCLSTRACWTV